VEGWIDLGTAVKVGNPCPRLYIAAAVAINTTVHGVIRTMGPLTPQWDMLTTIGHCDLYMRIQSRYQTECCYPTTDPWNRVIIVDATRLNQSWTSRYALYRLHCSNCLKKAVVYGCVYIFRSIHNCGTNAAQKVLTRGHSTEYIPPPSCD